jgi:hypothetical protein
MPVLKNVSSRVSFVSFACILLIDCFHELSDHERYTLDPLDLFLRAYQLPFETPVEKLESIAALECPNIPLFILDVFFLQVNIPNHCQQLCLAKLSGSLTQDAFAVS